MLLLKFKVFVEIIVGEHIVKSPYKLPSEYRARLGRALAGHRPKIIEIPDLCFNWGILD